MEKIKIRAAKAGDWKGISFLFGDLLKQHRNFGNFHEFHRDFDTRMETFVKKELKKKRTKFFVAEVENKIVGFVVTYLLKRPLMYKYEKYGWIEASIDKSYQRRGIGKKLTEEALRWVKSKKIKRVELEVNLRNEKGLKAWRKYGFKDYELIMYKEF